jgi:hypothetical protein
MLKCQANKFWCENPPNIVCDASIIPMKDMSLENKYNAITRLVILVFLILTVLNINHSGLFLIISLLIIIILYYLQKNRMGNKEPYISPNNFKNNTNMIPGTHNQKIPTKMHTQNTQGVPSLHSYPKPPINMGLDTRSSKRYCTPELALDGNNIGCNIPGGEGVFNNPEYVSDNQALAGPANPKTLMSPVVPAQSLDMTFWRANNLVSNSAINEDGQIDVYQSGYQVSTCCPPSGTFAVRSPVIPGNENKNNQLPYLKNGEQNTIIDNQVGGGIIGPNQDEIKENYKPPLNMEIITRSDDKGYTYDYPFIKSGSKLEGVIVIPNEAGWLNAGCGYNPNQLFKAGLPANLPAGTCTQDPRMKDYNESLFTSIIQPGVYKKTQINEQAVDNMGISFNQQFPPVHCTSDPETGDVMYTAYDPRIIDPSVYEEVKPEEPTRATETNIYDPRHTGYGTSYRAYTDERLGQTKFYYDDIDSVRMPNYITRSEIDHQPFADQYGTIKEGDEFGNKYNAEIRAMAQNAFLDGSLQFRTDLQERLMRKANSIAWQQRKAPIYKGGVRMLGGISSCK